ncbi:Glycosyltransferase involved in cell wall bisynthesis [Nocardioides terrae]|uniref:Glycosyltransferase involved in cell wall bisynthesis n=1 Tax=Nocardioides terrae TaxID=574651 RepID=A0A1I1HTT2_9ACTN|nr:glycosyltransferase [Nocardioides terrae]SFC27477.1 Glycosyltransferase involved in cell wall bisynthesis [Nocardioides terrae]
MESLGAVLSTTNPYIVQLIDSLHERSDVEIHLFSFRRAIFGRYDVLHIHWPEVTIGGHRPLGRLARRTLTTAMVLRLALTRTVIVRTWHNTDRPAGLSRWDQALLDAIDRLTVAVIRLNDHTPVPLDCPTRTIRHGHYRDWYAGHRVAVGRHSRRLLYFGLVRKYKGIDGLLKLAADKRDLDVELRFVGAPSDKELGELIRMRAARDHRISYLLEYVDDATLAREILQSSLVVLPYREMHNSGAVLLALSLDTPVLVPENPVTRELAAEVGPGWVHMFRGDLTMHDIRAALVRAQNRTLNSRPNLDARSWSEAGKAHAAVFRAALRRDSAAEVPNLDAP